MGGEETCIKEVVGLNPISGNWMDTFSHYVDVKIVMFVSTYQKQIKKEAGNGPLKYVSSHGSLIVKR